MNIEELITLTIFQALRETLVVKGYLPDITSFDVENPNAELAKAAVDNYRQAMKVIENDKGFCIELFNFSSNQAKGLKKVPRIVIDSLQFLPGFVGNDTTPIYIKDEATGYYTRETKESQKSDYNFNIYLVGNTAKQIMLMNDLLIRTLPKRGYIKRQGEAALKPSGNFFVRLLDSQKDDDLPEGVMERIFRYEIPDLDQVTFLDPTNISPIKEIKVDIKIGEGNINTITVE